MYGNVRCYFHSGNHYNRRILYLAENQKRERMAEKPLNNRIMDMLSLVYTLSAVIGGGFLVWLKTKSGKKWLESL